MLILKCKNKYLLGIFDGFYLLTDYTYNSTLKFLQYLHVHYFLWYSQQHCETIYITCFTKKEVLYLDEMTHT